MKVSVTSAINQLWRRGELSWKLRAEQQRFKREIEREGVQLVVGNISRRWGKSYTLVVYCIEQAMRVKGQKIRYATAFLTDLQEFILPAFEKILDDCPEYLRPVYLRSRQEFRFKNGSTIKLVGLDKKPNGLRGNAINIIVLDEAGFISNLKYQYQSVIIPATAKQTNVRILIVSTPPVSPEHYFCELISKAQTQPNGFYLKLTIDDISDLDPAERKRLLDEVGGETSPTARREFFCEILVDTERAIAPSFTKDAIQPVEPAHVHWMIFGDVGGVRDKSVFLQVGWCHEQGKVIFRREASFPKNTPTAEIVSSVKAAFGPTSERLVADMSGQTRIDFSAAGLFAASPAKDDFAAGLLLLNNAFHNNLVIIHPDCKLLIRTLEAGLLTRSRTDYERTDALGHCDAVAAAIYALRGVDRTTDARPKPNPADVITFAKPAAWSSITDALYQAR